jgi:uncharacterized membrane protein HdeD (DUF308 family)
MTEIPTLSQRTNLSARWKWFLALGITLLLLGLAAAGFTMLLHLTSLLVFGPLLLASSLIQLLTAFFAGKGRGSLLHLGAAGLEAVCGFLIMAYPFQGVADLLVLIAIFLLVSGVIRVVRSTATHSPGRVWILMAGAAALLLGFCVWLRLPVSQLWFAALCMAVDFLCHGVSWSAVAVAERKLLQAHSS